MTTASILLVEDDETLGVLTKKKLSERGYDVSYAKTLSEANELINKQSFTLAIFDLVLQDQNSLPLISAIHANNEDIKVLVLTGFASIATAVEAVKLGAHDYLPKPATINDMLKALGELQFENPDQEELKEATPLTPKRLEWEHIQRVLRDNNGNVSATARELKMHRRTLQRKLQKNPVKE